MNNTDTTLFDQNNSTEIDPTLTDDTVNYVEQLVGEGKKFKDVESLARGKAEADAHISRLEREAKLYREELQTRTTLDEFLDKMNRSGTNTNRNDPSNPDTTKEGEDVDTTETISTEKISDLIKRTLAEQEAERRANDNFDTVIGKLQEVYGPNYAPQLKSKAKELGLGEDFLNGLARNQPKAFFAILGIDPNAPPPEQRKVSVFTPPSNSVSSEGLSSRNRQSDKKTYKHYQELLRKNPSLHSDYKLHQEMMKQAQELGPEVFFDNN